MTIRNYTNTGAQSTLTGSIGATDTSIALAGYAGDPTPPFTAALARGTVTEEVILVTAVVGSTITAVRGYDGTSAQAQNAGATFQEVVAALDFREANNHVNATGAVHGTTSQLVGVSDAQTLTNKTLTSPTITAPTVTGTATMAGVTATSAAVSGPVTASGLVTASGGVTVPTGFKATLTDAPASATDGANKSYVDGKTWPTSALSDAASAATINVAVKRDGNGRAQFADPAAAQDVATKNYVDSARLTAGTWTYLQQGNTTYGYAIPGTLTTLPGHSFSVTVPSGRTLEVESSMPTVQMLYTGGNAHFQLVLGGSVLDSAFVSAPVLPAGGTGFPAAGPVKLAGQFTGSGAAVAIAVQASGTGAGANADTTGPWLRYRIW